MASITIFCVYLNLVVTLQNRIIYFWEIMLTEAHKVLKQYVFFLLTKLSNLINKDILKTFFYLEETMKLVVLTKFTDFLMNVQFI